jgi:hypothetical protein
MTEQNTVEIDRIVLRGLDVAPHRAEYIRALVEMELQHQLMKSNMINGLEERDVSHMEAQPVRLVQPQHEGCLSKQVAQSIMQALKNIR